MSTLRNRVQLIGRVGNDPEVKSFEGGKKLATVSVATSESYKK
jgi:single-strand DNA-binding protein